MTTCILYKTLTYIQFLWSQVLRLFEKVSRYSHYVLELKDNFEERREKAFRTVLGLIATLNLNRKQSYLLY